MTEPKPRRVLFLCSGNYYRSRFAEILFNRLASQSGLNWEATSCGLVVDIPNGNVGPISPHTVDALIARAILLTEEHRLPIQVTAEDLANADLIIAVKEGEHRPMLTRRFPGWEDKAIYWQVHDLDLANADEALTAIEQYVRELIQHLSER
ncbi:MAG: low molecular weight phosphatase family protein [Caldilineaceae bacterium]|nr:low molecular weight phosphatase family protein [Caldilineaceae bacterium]